MRLKDGLVFGALGVLGSVAGSAGGAGGVTLPAKDAEDAGKDEETLKSEYRAIAERRVRLGLLLSEIGQANGMSITGTNLFICGLLGLL